MRMILGLDRPTSGAAPVNGRPYVNSPAPLAEVDALLNAKAVESSRSARNHLLALGPTVSIRSGKRDVALCPKRANSEGHLELIRWSAQFPDVVLRWRTVVG